MTEMDPLLHGAGTSAAADTSAVHSNADDTSAAAGGASVMDSGVKDKVFRTLNLRPETKECLQNNLEKLEEILQLSSEEIKDKVDDKEGKKHARFNQAEREKLILLRRWMKNKRGDGDAQSFDTFVHEHVSRDILDEVLKELHLDDDVRHKIENERVLTPENFVEKSKYWYKHKIALKDADIHKIEKFKKWYTYQLDTYLPSDWIVSFRKEAAQVKELEWRKVLKAIGLKADAIQSLEINDICDFATLNETSETWRITKSDGDESSSDSNEWQKLGLKKNDARHIINFRHWHNFYVAGTKDKGFWAAEFSSAQYERFVQRYIDPSKPDKFKRPWLAMNDKLKPSKEKQAYLDMLEAAAEDGVVTEKDRYRLRQHYKGRREKMELIQEINEGVGDISYQEQRLREILDEEAKKENKKEMDDLKFIQKYYQFFFSALVVYALLVFWCGTTIYFIVQELLFEPVEAPVDFKGFEYSTTNSTSESAAKKAITMLQPMLQYFQSTSGNFKGFEYVTFIHNIVFGLVTAVVIQELGDGLKETNLYSRFLDTYRDRCIRKKERRFRNDIVVRQYSCRRCFLWLQESGDDFFMWLILESTRIYIVTWIFLGFVSLAFGSIKGLGTSNPLYTTGQTWLGIAVTIGYSYFGLNGKKEGAKDENDQRSNDAAQLHDDTNGGEEAKSTDTDDTDTHLRASRSSYGSFSASKTPNNLEAKAIAFN